MQANVVTPNIISFLTAHIVKSLSDTQSICPCNTPAQLFTQCSYVTHLLKSTDLLIQTDISHIQSPTWFTVCLKGCLPPLCVTCPPTLESVTSLMLQQRLPPW